MQKNPFGQRPLLLCPANSQMASVVHQYFAFCATAIEFNQRPLIW
jgi:hypothetical protein